MKTPNIDSKQGTWICDTCGQIIAKAKDGWIEWLERKEGEKFKGRGLRLVHAYPASPRQPGRCQYDGQREFQENQSTISDLDLESYLGPDGLTDLLSYIGEGQLPNLPTEEVLEMIKRLHVPGYEHARDHFEAAIREGVFEPNRPKGFYPTVDIEATLAFVKEEGE